MKTDTVKKRFGTVLLVAGALLLCAGLAAYFLFFYVPVYPRVEADISPQLVNKNADGQAVKLYDYLRSIYGRNIISGQQTLSFKENKGGFENEIIFQNTGKLPALNGFDMAYYAYFGDADQIDAAISWHNEQGGIVEFCWSWLVVGKDGNPTFENGKTAIDVKKAVISGTDENKKLTEDLKRAADGLELLKKAEVPVLWRPFHEANLKYFWWSKGGPDIYRKLWDMMFDYFVNVRELDNLIWVWNGQSKEWLVDGGKFDIASMDIYPRTKINRSSQVNMFNKCQGMAPTKMVALSECEFIPEPANLIRDKAYWLWYMPWFASYVYVASDDIYNPLPVEPYRLNPQYATTDDLKRIMNDDYVITLDRLPE